MKAVLGLVKEADGFGWNMDDVTRIDSKASIVVRVVHDRTSLKRFMRPIRLRRFGKSPTSQLLYINYGRQVNNNAVIPSDSFFILYVLWYNFVYNN